MERQTLYNPYSQAPANQHHVQATAPRGIRDMNHEGESLVSRYQGYLLQVGGEQETREHVTDNCGT